MQAIKNGQIYAIKKLDKQRIQKNEKQTISFKRETEIQKNLSHENLVKFFGYFEDKENISKSLEVQNEDISKMMDDIFKKEEASVICISVFNSTNLLI